MNLKKALLTFAVAAGFVSMGTVVASADTVTVKVGDTLSSIAQQHNTTVDELDKLNNLTDVNLIFPGQQIKVNEDNTQPSITTNVASQNSTVEQNNVTQVQSNTNSTQTSTASSSEEAAKAYIAGKESGGNYGARNGQYIGKYQLSSSYLNGDYSATNQERVANNYVASRYGSWAAAKAHWDANGWY